MSKYLKHNDGTIVDKNGMIQFFTNEKFKEVICKEDSCFLCGRPYEKSLFNNEHIIPKWLLKRVQIFKDFITLPNNSKIRYDQYVIPCCRDCNSFLGQNIEKKISDVTSRGLDGVNKYIEENGSWDFFIWLALIFLKTHLKDKYLKKSQDLREESEYISSEYEWGFLHHIHSLVRAVKMKGEINKECHGSLLILPARDVGIDSVYDYKDCYVANTILLRFDNIAFIAVFNDSNASYKVFLESRKKLTGHLCPVQLREVHAHITILNMKLKYRPMYFTHFNTSTGIYKITVQLPEKIELDTITSNEIGEMVWSNISQFTQGVDYSFLNEKKELIQKGVYQFLFNENGEFLKKTIDEELGRD